MCKFEIYFRDWWSVSEIKRIRGILLMKIHRKFSRFHWNLENFMWMSWAIINTLSDPRQDERHFADDIFTCIFFNENCCILIKFSLKYARKGPIDNNPPLVQIMAWRRSDDKPLSEPIMISLPTHICVTRPQWVKVWELSGPQLSLATFKTYKRRTTCRPDKKSWWLSSFSSCLHA